MKYVITLLTGIILSLSGLAEITADSYVLESTIEEGEFCCFKLLHVYFMDGRVIGYGISYAGYGEKNCCPKEAGVVEFTDTLHAEFIPAIQSFHSSSDFSQSVSLAITDYLLEQNGGMGSMEVQEVEDRPGIRLRFNASHSGAYTLIIHPFVSGEKVNKEILVNEGFNELFVEYDLSKQFGHSQHVLIKIISAKQGFKTVIKT